MVKQEKKGLGGLMQEFYFLYIIMELADYSLEIELQSRIKNKHRFSMKSLFFLLYDITNALAYLQKLNISHRDIKPANILKVNGIYKLADFGVSKYVPNNALHDNHSIKGSYAYLSPQLIEGLRKSKN